MRVIRPEEMSSSWFRSKDDQKGCVTMGISKSCRLVIPSASKLSCSTSLRISSEASTVCSFQDSPLSERRMTISRSLPRRAAKCGTSMITGLHKKQQLRVTKSTKSLQTFPVFGSFFYLFILMYQNYLILVNFGNYFFIDIDKIVQETLSFLLYFTSTHLDESKNANSVIV